MAAKQKKDSDSKTVDAMGREIRNRKRPVTSDDLRALAIELSKPSALVMRIADDMDNLGVDEITAVVGGIETNYEALMKKIVEQFESKILVESRKKGKFDRRKYDNS